MPNTDTDQFEREIDVFCRYLIGRSADEYVTNCYLKAHQTGPLILTERGSRFDELLVRIARISPVCTRLADVYASVWQARRLRSKLVLLLGILENSPAHYQHVSPPPRLSRGGFIVAAGAMAVVYAVNVLVVTLVFLPLRLVYRLRGNDGCNSS